MIRSGSFRITFLSFALLVQLPAYAVMDGLSAYEPFNEMVEIDAVQDTYITEHTGYGGKNKVQGENLLRVLKGITGLHRTHSVIQFDLSTFEGKVIKGDVVDFTVYIRSGWSGNHVTQSISVRECLVNWDENSATWANFGGAGFNAGAHTGPNLVTQNVTYHGLTEPVVFSIPSGVVQRWINDPKSNHGLFLISNTSATLRDMAFWSKETGPAPSLSFEFEGSPEMDIQSDMLTNTMCVAGDSTTRSMTISNVGDADLEFSFCPDVPDLDDSLVAYYPFNGNANDETGNGHDGNVVGATLATDRFGNPDSAYLFDGVDDAIRVSDSEVLRLANTDYTISAWFYGTATNPSYHDALVTKRGSGSSNGWFCSVTANTPGLPGPGYLFLTTSGGTDPRIYGKSIVEKHQWNHACLTYNYAAKTVSIYVNGVLDTAGGNMPTPNPLTTADMVIGLDSALSTYGFHGKIDDIRIYKRALSDNEVVTLYEQEMNPPEKLQVHAAQDTYITEHDGWGGKYATRGTNALVVLKGITGLHRTHSLVQFDVSAFEGGEIKGKTVDFTVFISAGWGGQHVTQSISVRECLVEWDEDSATWAGFGGTGFSEAAHTGPNLTTRSVTYNGITEPIIFSIPSEVVQRWIDSPESNHGLILVSNTDQMLRDMKFWSKETGPAPSLSFAVVGKEKCSFPEWLAIDPKSGTVAPGESVDVAITFNASNRVAGDYVEYGLQLLSNDPEYPELEAPVSMWVIPSVPEIHTEPLCTIGSSNVVAWSYQEGPVEYWVEAMAVQHYAPASRAGDDATPLGWDAQKRFSQNLDVWSKESGWLESTSYLFDGLRLNTIYLYRVKASVMTGIGRLEGEWSDWTPSCQVPVLPNSTR